MKEEASETEDTKDEEFRERQNSAIESVIKATQSMIRNIKTMDIRAEMLYTIIWEKQCPLYTNS